MAANEGLVRSLLASSMAASFLLASPVAFADDAPSSGPPKPAPNATAWYGYQTLAVDGAALAIALPGFATQDPRLTTGLLFSGLGTYALGGTIVHWAHGNDGKGFADLGIRVGLPTVLGLIGAGIASATWHPPALNCPPHSTDCGAESDGKQGAVFQGFFVGGLIGVAGAIAIDAAVLAREPVPKPDENDGPHMMDPLASRATPTQAHLEPTLHVAPERTGGAQATVGLIGIF